MLTKYEKPEIELLMHQMEGIITESLGGLEEINPEIPENNEEWGNIFGICKPYSRNYSIRNGNYAIVTDNR